VSIIQPGTYRINNVLVAKQDKQQLYLKQNSVIIVVFVKKCLDLLTSHHVDALYKGKLIEIKGSLETLTGSWTKI